VAAAKITCSVVTVSGGHPASDECLEEGAELRLSAIYTHSSRPRMQACTR
jgi:hypothetical protein